MHNKGGPGGASSKDEKWHDFYECSGTQLQTFPLPGDYPPEAARRLDYVAQRLTALRPNTVVRNAVPTAAMLGEHHKQSDATLTAMIASQEELDWECYKLYGILDDVPLYENAPPIKLGQRAFEIVLARRVAAGSLETKWFDWLGIKPIMEIPEEWPEDYRKVVERRIDIIQNDKNIGLIEDPRCKRRWETEPWEQQEERALRGWLLDRLEGSFDLDGRMNEREEPTARGELREPRLISVAKVADFARQDKDFMQVAEIFTGRMDFDVGALVGELVDAESMPALPVLRYKPAAMDKRAAWERIWDLQRLEDAVNALFEVERLKKIDPSKAEDTLRPLIAAIQLDEQARPRVLHEATSAADYVAEAVEQKLNLTSDAVLQPVQDAAKRAKKAAVGDISVPPKYTSADFISGNFWRLRGKLDVPKERWVSFPHCEGEDGTLVIAWAGYNHLQLARAIAERYELAKEQEGRKPVPLLAAIGQLIPWLKQWHNELDPAFGTCMGDYFEGYLAEEAKALGMSVDQVLAWTPPEKVKGRGRKRS